MLKYSGACTASPPGSRKTRAGCGGGGEGLTEADGEDDGLSDDEGEILLLGESLALGLKEADGEMDGEPLELGETD